MRAESLVKTGERTQVELISASTRGFAVSMLPKALNKVFLFLFFTIFVAKLNIHLVF